MKIHCMLICFLLAALASASPVPEAEMSGGEELYMGSDPELTEPELPESPESEGWFPWFTNKESNVEETSDEEEDIGHLPQYKRFLHTSRITAQNLKVVVQMLERSMYGTIKFLTYMENLVQQQQDTMYDLPGAVSHRNSDKIMEDLRKELTHEETFFGRKRRSVSDVQIVKDTPQQTFSEDSVTHEDRQTRDSSLASLLERLEKIVVTAGIEDRPTTDFASILDKMQRIVSTKDDHESLRNSEESGQMLTGSLELQSSPVFKDEILTAFCRYTAYLCALLMLLYIVYCMNRSLHWLELCYSILYKYRPSTKPDFSQQKKSTTEAAKIYPEMPAWARRK